MLSRIVGIIGPFPEYMMKEGKLVSNYFTREGLIYQEAKDSAESDKESSKKSASRRPIATEEGELKIHVLVAKKTTLKQRM
jgi:hypothetical protein